MSQRKHLVDQDKQNEIELPIMRVVTTDEIKGSANRVDPSGMSFLAFWRGRIVYENGRVKRFETENEAYEFLARCNSAGRFIH